MPKKSRRPLFRTEQPAMLTGAIDWAEIRDRAREFAAEWKDGEDSEIAESQSFWNGFFGIFGRNRRGLATYEYHASKSPRLSGRIDLLWPGMLAVEHKSRGRDLDGAQRQLDNYILGLGDPDKPRYGLVCDFARFRLTDYEKNTRPKVFNLSDLPDNVELFEFFVEKERKQFALELKASQDAAELMGAIYDAIADSEQRIVSADRLLVRLLFCMFAEDTGIFSRKMFFNYLSENTKEDGSDFGMYLSQLFSVLDTEESRRHPRMPANLRAFPYVNGELFHDNDHNNVTHVDAEIRAAILDACRFDWKDISPDIFGSLFQAVRDPQDRRDFGAHYTSEDNIMKVIRPLFLDGLERELHRIDGDKKKLRAFHDKIANLRFLDPACGCGNFLVVAYRELRRLEMTVLTRLGIPANADPRTLVRVRITQFYGLESDSFPARVAQSAMWLVADQMNREFKEMHDLDIPSIPLTETANIKICNALRTDWAREIAAPENMSYIFGNPPFVGNYLRTPKQKEDMRLVFNSETGTGNLDYVAAWYMRAAEYIRGTDIRCAFVSTNSITQGEQVAALWKRLLQQGVKIHFAHRTFRWTNEGSGKAHVYVVIVGFGMRQIRGKAIYQYAHIRGAPKRVAAKRINPYLVDGESLFVAPRSTPFCDVPPMVRGSGPTDGGNFLFTDEEKREFLQIAPRAAPFMRRAIGGREYLHNERRWCLWLNDVKKSEFRGIRPIMERVNRVRKFRASSKAAATKLAAETPHLFQSIRPAKCRYIVVPRVSSETRPYFPVGFAPASHIALDSCIMLPDGKLYEFGILSSAMHMAWIRTVAGRLKSDYRYSNTLVYNNFPWPQKITAAKKAKIEKCARAVLEARKNHPAMNLAEMYSKMSSDLRETPRELRSLAAAHRALDRAVDSAYRAASFDGESARLEFLFSEYNRLTANLGGNGKGEKQ